MSLELPKIVEPRVGNVTGPFESVTKEYLRAELTASLPHMEVTLLEKLTALIAPQNAQIQTIQESVTQLSQTMEAARELSLTNQEASRHLQKQNEWAMEKIMFLEIQLKMENLKFRSFLLFYNNFY